ncbi:serine-rich adhesin for platelets-like isoform X5 [Ostrea edulis]|uniref:serine-rich adhesin for platelets-like isoform X5 n=1 Tax=Ostrea edulis TaxID=37623 RepID=UPI0024AFFB8B|nr:serine-rich adhesin for platelets-like isoform X5 [Ostrea edulis]
MDVLEKKIEDLSRQLTYEKQQHRKEKQQVAKLQRELTRAKSDSQKIFSKEAPLLKEVEQERMLRHEAEKRLKDMTTESESCQTRLQSLQGEFKKYVQPKEQTDPFHVNVTSLSARMEEMVKSMMQYKTKIEQLKQEKSSLSITYESNLQKYRSYISNLERENMMLLNDVKRFETQMDGKTDERSKLLLERLKMLEAENSSLVLENEQQRQQYEKCLDEIANQVVQALLAQKTLREECVKLQKKVNELEHQNMELNHMFQQKSQYSSQALIKSTSQSMSSSTLCDQQSCSNSVTSLPAQISSAISLTQTMHLSPMSQYILQNTVAQKCLQHFIPDSTESLQSITSDFPAEEQRPRSVSTSSCVPSSHSEGVGPHTKIETEFPATPSSPKVKHISIAERVRTKRSSSVSSLQGPVKPVRTNSTSALPKTRISQPVQSRSITDVNNSQVMSISVNQLDVNSKKSVSQPDSINKVNKQTLSTRSVKVQSSLSSGKSAQNKTSIPIKHTSKSQPSLPQTTKAILRPFTKQERSMKESSFIRKTSSTEVVTHSKTSNLSNAIKSNSSSAHQVCSGQLDKSEISKTSTDKRMDAIKENLGNPPSVPLLPKAQYFYEYSDEDSDFNRPVSADFSTTSTVSLNELLEEEDTDTLLDEEFTAETFAFFDSPTFVTKTSHEDSKSVSKEIQIRKEKSSSLGSKPDIVKDTLNCVPAKSPLMSRRRSMQHPNKRKYQTQRPNSLVLTPKEKQFMYHGYSSSSLSSTDSDETWSPKMERKNRPHHKPKRKSSSSSNRSSYHSSSVSDKQSLKSSQELTPVATDVPKLPKANSVSTEMLQKSEVISAYHPSESNESLNTNSLTRKGPPPPVPKKPSTGKKSPGIRMGLQSPGFRQNKPTLVPTLSKEKINIPKPHEFKTDFSNSTESLQQHHIINTPEICKLNPKYVASSDSSFESNKSDRVERSGSKDDGYSTMSSDIQPELQEKYNDGAQVNVDSIDRNKMVVKDTSPVTPAESNKSHKSSTGSEGDSMIGHASGSEAVTSSSSVSSPHFSDTPSPQSPAYGSLGRVKAMKLLFEAESQKSNDCKSFRFPLRKSPSVDSTLSSKCSHPEVNLKRHSLGDDSALFNNTQSEQEKEKQKDHKVEVMAEVHPTPTAKTFVSETSFEPYAPPSKLVLKPVIPETPPSFQPLHLSEENFLSDIPEEKDECEMSTASSVNRLDCSSRYHQPLVKHLEHLHMFKVRKHKTMWSSLQGLSRAFSDSDLHRCGGSSDDNELEQILNCGKGGNLSLERSTSLNDLRKKKNVKCSVKATLPLIRHGHKMVIDEVKVIGQVQEIIKAHIYHQLSMESESEDDLHSLSYTQILANKQKKEQRYQQILSQMSPYTDLSQIPNLGTDKQQKLSAAQYSENMVIEQRFVRQGTPSSDSSCPEVDSKFRSDYYSLCMVGSKGSLFNGSNDGDQEHCKTEQAPQHTCKETNDKKNCQGCISAKNTQEFDEISRQLASLSKTVNALHRSLTSLNSHDSDTESNEDQVQLFPTTAENFRDNDGYQWVEDEFYLTPCGGEIIMGGSPFSETGACADWVNDYMDDTSCNDEFEYYGNIPPSNPNGKYDFKSLCESIMEDDINPVTSTGNGEERISEERITEEKIPIKMMEKPTRGVESKKSKVGSSSLDAMVHLSGESMESLDDNIGVDHVMCSRLIGRGEKGHGAVRCTQVSRPAVDLSQYFSHFGEREQEAVAAFDFLHDMSPSPDGLQNKIQVKVNKEEEVKEMDKVGDSSTDVKNKDGHNGATKTKTTIEEPTEKQKPVKENGIAKLIPTGSPKNINQKAEDGLAKKVPPPAKAPQNKSKAQPKANPNPGRFHLFRKRGTEDVEKKQTLGLDSANSNLTNEKSANKHKEDKKILSKLPRKLIPTKNKSTKPKVESKIPKATTK